MKHKERLDVVLVERGLCDSRSKAQALIMSGEVYVNGQKSDKAGTPVEDEAVVELRGNPCPYVSRGGLKLEKALRDFGVDPTGFVCSDSGASTGGFTDCLLQKGAKKVFAIDVGYGQLAWSIRQDPRVVCMERTNIRYVTPEQLGEPLDLSVVDVSFISLRIVLPAIRALLKPTGQILCLIKPQFEAGREKVGKKGVVRDPAVHEEVLQNFLALAAELLEKALRDFGVDPTGFVCSDSGASTGGFTDCLLQKGAKKVFAIDVGYGQLAWSIRQDPRVVCMERTNIRYVTPEQLGEPLDLSVVDVSFISLRIVLPAIRALLKPTGQILCLIKPQFEAGREKVGKKGVVRDPAVHEEVLQNFLALAAELELTVRNLTFSPVRGPEGNIEFLGHLSMEPQGGITPDVPALVAQAHAELRG